MNDIFDLQPQSFDNISELSPSSEWLEMLNKEQKEAVTTTQGPVLVLSGAGTGKTKVLTTRLTYILSKHLAQPWNCLVVTFTNRAAKEMKERVEALIGPMANDVWLGTFHSVCVKILRRHAELVGLKSNFTILNTDDQKRLIKQIEEAENIDLQKYPPQAILDKISRWKDKGISVDKIDNDFKENTVTLVYKKYQQRLLELNCVDFGDIILHALNLLLGNNDILEKYQDRFKYIMVDEYQDTNVTQYLLIRLLSQKHRNLCCVGDDDQSIYSWRGAEIENILRFNKDFKDAKIVKLESNYRSTANILAAAANLITHNTGRLGKTLKVAENSPALKSENHKIKIKNNYNGEEEAKYCVDEIESNLRQGYKYSDCAILVRTAAQTREFEEKFMSEAIPYKVIGGLKFYDRAEIRDALAYFRVVLQPDDDLAFFRIINKPARGVGAKSLEKFQTEAFAAHISTYKAVENLLEQNAVTGKAKTTLHNLMNNFKEWRKTLNAVTPDELASQILEDSGYIDMLKLDKSAEAPGRLENLKELINVMSDTDKYPTLSEFMEHVSLVMDKDDANSDNKVQLITLHSAKGLEFDIVFLPGWEEGLFPHQRSLDEGNESLEEERRLAYVAITRAKKRLYITLAQKRRVYGQWQNNNPSRFINELPSQNIEIEKNNYYSNNNYSNSYGNNYNKKNDYNKSNDYNNNDYSSNDYSNNDYSQSSYNSYKPSPAKTKKTSLAGVRVHHQTFGYGTILKNEGNKLEVEFENSGIKRLMSDYVTRV